MFLSLVSLATFLAAALVVAGAYSIVSDLYLRDRSRISQRLDEEFSQRQRARAQRSPLFKELGKLKNEAALEDLVESDWRARLETMIEQSGLEITVRRLLSLAGLTGLALAILAGLLSGQILPSLALGVIGSGLPLLYVHFKRKRRLEKILSQLPDALDLMARAISAGQTMAQALQAIASEFQPPIAAEFAYCYEQQNLGLPPEIAFQDLARRTGLLEIKIFILAMLVQRQTGGNLAELLEKLATVVRDRFRIKGKIKVLTAEGRAQAVVLLAMPPLMFLLMLFINRQYTLVLLEHPGHLMGLGASMLVGTLWIRRLVNFDF